MNTTNLIQEIALNIMTVPGFQNFASLIEPEENLDIFQNPILEKAFNVTEGSKGLKIKMGVILLLNARTKILIEQIRQEVLLVLTRKKIKLESLDIFVQGVK